MSGLPTSPSREAQSLRDLVAAVPCAVCQFDVDPDGERQYRYLSPGIETLYGIPPEVAYDDPEVLLRCVAAEDRTGHQRSIEYATTTLTPWVHEYRILTPDGERKWVRAEATPRRHDNGRVTWYGLLTDVSGQKAVEAALQDSEARYRRLLEHLHPGVVVHAADTRILLANRQASRLLGLSEQGILGRTARTRAWPLVREDGTPMPLDDYPVNRVRRTHKPLRDLLVGVDRPDMGDRVWAMANAYPEWDAHGRLHDIVVTFIDITVRVETEKALRVAMARYEAIVEGMPDMMCRSLPDGTLTYVNDVYCRYFRRSAADLVSRSFLPLTPRECRDSVKSQIAECNVAHPVVVNEHSVIRGDGVERTVQWNNRAILDNDGALVEIQSVGRDVTDQRDSERALRESEALTAAVLNALPESMVVLDARARVVRVNSAWERLCDANGGSPATRQPIGVNYRDLCLAATTPEDRELAVQAWGGIDAVAQGRRDHFRMEYACNSPDNERWFEMRVVPLPAPPPRGVVVAHQNITERRCLEDTLRSIASTDHLTGVSSRRAFMARLDEELARMHRQETRRAAVLMIDLDHFKSVNDGAGHAAGDEVLQHVAALMQASTRRIDHVGRLGGEEFSILLPGVDLTAAQTFAERLRRTVEATPACYRGDPLPVTVSIGVGAMTDGDRDIDQVLRRADTALYRAKALARNRVEIAAESGSG